uniref:C-type lectin domain-containing protein n=1 Tax=Arion vulgaris TaxID=1028688 RepID=A0A0B6Y7S8_9EUPU
MMRLVLLLALSAHCVLSHHDVCYYGWVPYDGYCYGFFLEEVNWILAAASCSQFGGRLAEVDNEERDKWLIEQAEHRKLGPTWIGGSARLHPGLWFWVPSHRAVEAYTNWIQGVPINAGHCLEIVYGDKKGWNDRDCSLPRRFICEIKVEDVDDTRETRPAKDKESRDVDDTKETRPGDKESR